MEETSRLTIGQDVSVIRLSRPHRLCRAPLHLQDDLRLPRVLTSEASTVLSPSENTHKLEFRRISRLVANAMGRFLCAFHLHNRAPAIRILLFQWEETHMGGKVDLLQGRSARDSVSQIVLLEARRGYGNSAARNVDRSPQGRAIPQGSYRRTLLPHGTAQGLIEKRLRWGESEDNPARLSLQTHCFRRKTTQEETRSGLGPDNWASSAHGARIATSRTLWTALTLSLLWWHLLSFPSICRQNLDVRRRAAVSHRRSHPGSYRTWPVSEGYRAAGKDGS